MVNFFFLTRSSRYPFAKLYIFLCGNSQLTTRLVNSMSNHQRQSTVIDGTHVRTRIISSLSNECLPFSAYAMCNLPTRDLYSLFLNRLRLKCTLLKKLRVQLSVPYGTRYVDTSIVERMRVVSDYRTCVESKRTNIQEYSMDMNRGIAHLQKQR